MKKCLVAQLSLSVDVGIDFRIYKYALILLKILFIIDIFQLLHHLLVSAYCVPPVYANTTILPTLNVAPNHTFWMVGLANQIVHCHYMIRRRHV